MELEGVTPLQRRLQALASGEYTRPTLGAFGLLAVQRAKGHVPRKTGNLDRTIRVGDIDVPGRTVKVVAGGTGRRGANQYGVHTRSSVGYASHVEYGTGPHVILPRNRKALAWGGPRRLSGSLRKGAKATSFARRVNHPGTRARPYLRPGAVEALREVGLSGHVVTVWNEAA